jgi:hypothetical protein
MEGGGGDNGEPAPAGGAANWKAVFDGRRSA